MMQKLLEAELTFRASINCQRLTVSEFCRRFAALGYRVDRSMDCRGLSRYMTGEHAGRSYPHCDTGINEADTGRRAWHFEARRDSNFKAMQELRGQIFAVTRDGYILEV